MKQTIILTATRRGIKRMLKNTKSPALQKGEIAISLQIDIPELLFDTFYPVAKITVSRDDVVLPKVGKQNQNNNGVKSNDSVIDDAVEEVKRLLGKDLTTQAEM